MRRDVLMKILDEWVIVCGDKAVVETLMIALSTPGFMDVKLRVEILLARNLR